ncbi:MAG: hypothetical protein ACYSUC_12320 [Planctomycetota bacterium]|jgi:hypothetical protein
MTKTTRRCEKCWKNPAEVPDRNRMGRPIKRICLSCHADLLRGDLAAVLRRRHERAADA